MLVLTIAFAELLCRRIESGVSCDHAPAETALVDVLCDALVASDGTEAAAELGASGGRGQHFSPEYAHGEAGSSQGGGRYRRNDWR